MHKGEDLSKRPEYLFIASGKVKFSFQTSQHKIAELIAEAGTEVIIYPNVVHKTEIIEDAILLEARTTIINLGRPDTYPKKL